MLDEYVATVAVFVHLLPNYPGGEEQKKWATENENEHVKDLQDWAKSDEVKKILEAQELFRRVNTPTNKHQTNEECVEFCNNKFNHSTLKSSANKAVHLTESRWDEGVNAKHKWSNYLKNK